MCKDYFNIYLRYDFVRTGMCAKHLNAWVLLPLVR